MVVGIEVDVIRMMLKANHIEGVENARRNSSLALILLLAFVLRERGAGGGLFV